MRWGIGLNRNIHVFKYWTVVRIFYYSGPVNGNKTVNFISPVPLKRHGQDHTLSWERDRDGRPAEPFNMKTFNVSKRVKEYDENNIVRKVRKEN